MRVRRAKERDEGVSDELVDKTAELLHRSAQLFKQLVLKCLHDLRVKTLGHGRETAEVREQDSDSAPVGLALRH
jgi:hypothetical protein